MVPPSLSLSLWLERKKNCIDGVVPLYLSLVKHDRLIFFSHHKAGIPVTRLAFLLILFASYLHGLSQAQAVPSSQRTTPTFAIDENERIVARSTYTCNVTNSNPSGTGSLAGCVSGIGISTNGIIYFTGISVVSITTLIAFGSNDWTLLGPVTLALSTTAQSSAADLTLENLSIQATVGWTTTATMTLNNVTITGQTLSTTFLQGGNIIAQNSTFTNNVVTSNTGVFMKATFGVIVLYSCSFSNNNVVLYLLYATAELVISGSHFTNNGDTAGDLIHANTYTSVDSSQFTNNVVFGSLIYVKNSGNFSSSTFTNNTVLSGNNGVALNVRGNVLGYTNITNCAFNSNNATFKSNTPVVLSLNPTYINGGSFGSNLGPLVEASGVLAISGSLFSNNVAQITCSGVTGVTVSVTSGSNFTGNTGYTNVLLASGNLTMSQSSATGNSATNDVLHSSGVGLVDYCNFTSNAADNTLYLHGFGNVTYCNFISNTANGANAAGVQIDSPATGSTSYITYSNFSDNQAQLVNGGGTVLASVPLQYNNNYMGGNTGNLIVATADIWIDSLKAEYNSGKNNTGLVTGSQNLTLTNSLWYSNNVTGNAGALMLGKAVLSIYQSTFTDNSATRGLHATGSLAIVDETVVNTFYGEFVDLGTTASLKLTNSQISYVSGFQRGTYSGASSGIYVSNCTFSSCGAKRGGALWLNGPTNTVLNSAFISNTATQFGAAIYVTGATATVTSCTFTTNSADSGGAIYAAHAVSITDCTFQNNTASSSASAGGAVFGNSISITSSNFTGNIANASNSQGGAVYSSNYTNILWCNFIQNSAFNGGAAFVSTAIVEASTFASNVATPTSATTAAAIKSTSTLMIVDGTFNNNEVS